MKIDKPKNSTLLLAGLCAFAAGFVVLSLGQASPAPTSDDDPYMNVAEATAMDNGATVNPPVLTVLSTHPSNHYFGYRALLAIVFDRDNPQHNIERAEYLHAFLTFFFTFLLVLILFNVTNSIYATLFGVLVGMAFYVFARFSLLRSDVLSTTFVLAFTWALMTRNRRLMFLIATIFPIVYSTPLMIYFPLIAYTLTVLLKERWAGISGLTKDIFLTLAGTSIGIFVLHPEPLNYLYTGTWLNIRSMFFASMLPVPAELLPYIPRISDIPWLVLFLCGISMYVLYLIKYRSLKDFSFQTVFINILTTLFFFLFFSTQRFGVYLFPLFGLWSAVTITNTKHTLSFIRPLFNPVVLTVFGMALGTGLFSFYVNVRVQPPVDLHKLSGAYLRENPGLTFVMRFDMYPHIIYHNHQAQISFGASNIFTEVYDRDLALLYKLVSEAGVTPSVGVSGFRARYILEDGLNKRFSQALEKDPCVALVFTDPTYSRVKIYELNLPCVEKVLAT